MSGVDLVDVAWRNYSQLNDVHVALTSRYTLLQHPSQKCDLLGTKKHFNLASLGNVELRAHYQSPDNLTSHHIGLHEMNSCYTDRVFRPSFDPGWRMQYTEHIGSFYRKGLNVPSNARISDCKSISS